MKIKTLSLLILLVPCLAFATIYKSRDKQGNVSFSDTPEAGAKPVKLQQPQTFQPPQPHMLAPLSQQVQSQVFKPKIFNIAIPENSATLRNNSGNMMVNLALEPALPQDYKIKLMLDGSEQGQPAATTVFTLQNVNRGAHTLSALILDPQGNTVAKTPSVTFYMHQARITIQGIRSQVDNGMPIAFQPYYKIANGKAQAIAQFQKAETFAPSHNVNILDSDANE